MLKKLLNGEFSLAATFWKYGVLGLFILNIVVLIFGKLLAIRLHGMSLLTYYTRHISFLNYNTWTIVLTLCYLSTLVSLLVYCYMFTVGLWRSSAEYDKSIWLRFIARVLGLILVIISLRLQFPF